MSVLNKFASALLLTTLLVCVVGCEKYKGPPLAKCSGTVTYNGSPLEGAGVTMQSSQGLSKGRTDANGKFTMETVQNGIAYPGAPVGTLTVIITKVGVDKVLEKLGPAPDGADVEASTEYAEKSGKLREEIEKSGGKTQESLIPTKYTSPSTTDLKVELTKEGKEDIVFDLKD